MEDYCDGEAFKSHALFSVQTTAIQILFYFDELEVCSPIGTKAKIHKLGMYIYFACVLYAVCAKCTYLQEPFISQLATYHQSAGLDCHPYIWLRWLNQRLLEIMEWIQC